MPKARYIWHCTAHSLARLWHLLRTMAEVHEFTGRRRAGVRSLQRYYVEEVASLVPRPQCSDEWLRRWRRLSKIAYKNPGRRLRVTPSQIRQRMEDIMANVRYCRSLTDMPPMSFISYDEKPIWFNAAGREPGLAKKRRPQSRPKENLPQQRRRYTICTGVSTDDPAPAPRLAILFR